MSTNAELVCSDISKAFSGKTLFRKVSFSLTFGKSVAVTGGNGTGKSTLVKIIAQLLRASSGTISLTENGTTVPQMKYFTRTGLLSPYLNLYDEFSGYENLSFFKSLKSGGGHDNEKIDSLLNKVGLYAKRNELVRNYSSGMKQRLKLAFALLNDPLLLLLDEPRSNLDRSGIDVVCEIAELQKSKGLLIIATNDEDDRNLCDESLNIEDFRK